MNMPIRHHIGSFPSYMWKSEAQIINRLISEILKRGLSITVHDGVEIALRKSGDRAAIQREVGATDETQFIVFNTSGLEVAWFYMVHGNWCDVVADYTDNPLANEIMEAVEKTAARLEEAGAR